MSVVRENTASRVSVIIKKTHFVSCMIDSPMRAFFLVIRLLVTMERWASQYDSFSCLKHLKERF